MKTVNPNEAPEGYTAHKYVPGSAQYGCRACAWYSLGCEKVHCLCCKRADECSVMFTKNEETKNEETKNEETKMQTIHEQLAMASDIKIGDTVKVTHKVPTGNLGWESPWIQLMNPCVGNTGTILSVRPRRGVQIDFNLEGNLVDLKDYYLVNLKNYWFPYQVLEKVDPPLPKLQRYQPLLSTHGARINVGCKHFDITDIIRFNAAMTELRALGVRVDRLSPHEAVDSMNAADFQVWLNIMERKLRERMIQ